MASVDGTKFTACLALDDGTLFFGHGFGAEGETVAELCFNTAMTGYQEIMTTLICWQIGVHISSYRECGHHR